jgi:hypothetical protein
VEAHVAHQHSASVDATPETECGRGKTCPLCGGLTIFLTKPDSTNSAKFGLWFVMVFDDSPTVSSEYRRLDYIGYQKEKHKQPMSFDSAPANAGWFLKYGQGQTPSNSRIC